MSNAESLWTNSEFKFSAGSNIAENLEQCFGTILVLQTNYLFSILESSSSTDAGQTVFAQFKSQD